MYLPRNNAGDLEIERHRGKIPTLGWVRFKEYGYVPSEGQALSVTITRRAGRYYASFVFEVKSAIAESSVNSRARYENSKQERRKLLQKSVLVQAWTSRGSKFSGHVKRDLKLRDRVYICSECGSVMDRGYALRRVSRPDCLIKSSSFGKRGQVEQGILPKG